MEVMEELLNDGEASDEGSYGRRQWKLQAVMSSAEEAMVLSLDDGRSCTQKQRWQKEATNEG